MTTTETQDSRLFSVSPETSLGARAYLLSLHPGTILRHDFLEPLHLSPDHLVADTGLLPAWVDRFLQAKCAVTASTALRLSAYLGTSPEWWLRLQAHHDLERARLRARNARQPVHLHPAQAQRLTSRETTS